MHNQHRKVIRTGTSDTVVGNNDISLRGAGPVDDIRGTRRSFGRRREVVAWNVTTLPIGKQTLNLFQDRVLMHITRNNQDCIVGHKRRAMEFNKSLARRGIDRLRSWCSDVIRMLTKHYSRYHLARQKRRLCPLLFKTFLGVLFRQFDLVRWKHWAQRDVG